MTNPLDWIKSEIDELVEQGQFRTRRIRESPHASGMVQIDGKPLVDFGANDYLGLSSDHRLVNAVKQNAGYLGWGSGASPILHGRGTLHARLERDLANFEQTEAALLFSTGFAANVGVITSLVGRGDVIFSDEKNHASLIDGCRLSQAKTVVYRHNDIQHLEQELIATGFNGRKLIVSDGLFSMDGDLALVDRLADLRDRYGAMLMVDEAHATGIFGTHGRGAAEHFSVEDRVDVRVSTLSKAIGCHGGFVSGSQALIDWIANNARAYIFSTAMPDPACAAAIAALEIINLDPAAGRQLLPKAERVRATLQEIGFNTGKSESQIIPVILKDNNRTMEIHRQLKEEGYYVPGIRPPAVPKGQSLLRISLNTRHTDKMIDGLIKCLCKLFSLPGQFESPSAALSDS